MARLKNPFAFTPAPVTIIISVVYLAIIVSLLVVHYTVPEPRHIDSVDQQEAWQDLQFLSSAFHPYNSHRNDVVRQWLLERIQQIVGVHIVTPPPIEAHGSTDASRQAPLTLHEAGEGTSSPADGKVLIFSDTVSNQSFSTNGSAIRPPVSTYFEGTNIIVYIRGDEDDRSRWWMSNGSMNDDGGVLVNAHYDSVSTGFGATDDGMGVVTILQILRYFSMPGNQPKKGIVALLNNGEEDYLNGARAFFKHPISRFPKTFLNLEGAGAGGKATLFRTTNTEVTKAYRAAKFPLGIVLSADGFKRGLIKSDTDYSVFYPQGMQGLDVAFFEMRSRYHTNQDDTRHSSQSSLYHMLSSALPTMKALTDAPDEDRTEGTDAVWFDLFTSAFAVFRLETLFALSVTLLVVSAVTLSVIGAFLYRTDRNYVLSGSVKTTGSNGGEGEPVSIKGRRGVLRWPIAFLLATAVAVALALLIDKVNPYIVYSSPLAVWATVISAWVCVAWVSVCTADHFRPTAFQRLYTIMWMGLAAWIFHVVAAIFEKKQQIGGAYLIFFYHAAIFLTAVISLLEIFGLPKKTEYAAALQSRGPSQRLGGAPDAGSLSSAPLIAPSDDEGQARREGRSSGVDDEEDREADEETSLLRGSRSGLTTFKHYSSTHDRAEAEEQEVTERQPTRRVYHLEQAWSHSLPSYLWLLEFLIIAPFPIIIFGQVSLFLTSALYQTLADGGSPLTTYLAFSVLTVFIFAPIGPFLHRFTYHIPFLLFSVLIATTIYNLVAFPFSAENRLKIRFIQKVDLVTGDNNVTLTGVGGGTYLKDIIASLPSTYEQTPHCETGYTRKHGTVDYASTGLLDCNYTGLSPKLFASSGTPTAMKHPFKSLLTFDISLSRNQSTTAHFRLSGHNTRACKLVFDQRIQNYHIEGSAPDDPRFPKSTEDGISELRLWSRTWDREWKGSIQWQQSDSAAKKSYGLSGKALCMWSDANEEGTIPALDELWKFAPAWVAVTKAGDGLVEGWKNWRV